MKALAILRWVIPAFCAATTIEYREIAALLEDPLQRLDNVASHRRSFLRVFFLKLTLRSLGFGEVLGDTTIGEGKFLTPFCHLGDDFFDVSQTQSRVCVEKSISAVLHPDHGQSRDCEGVFGDFDFIRTRDGREANGNRKDRHESEQRTDIRFHGSIKTMCQERDDQTFISAFRCGAKEMWSVFFREEKAILAWQCLRVAIRGDQARIGRRPDQRHLV
jgi:hypothetical protein